MDNGLLVSHPATQHNALLSSSLTRIKNVININCAINGVSVSRHGTHCSIRPSYYVQNVDLDCDPNFFWSSIGHFSALVLPYNYTPITIKLERSQRGSTWDYLQLVLCARPVQLM